MSLAYPTGGRRESPTARSPEELGPEPARQHIHTVVRTPNGNDYGKDLLRQHYEEHADDPDHDHGGDGH